MVPLVVSTQYLGRLSRGVVAALFGNLGTQVCMNMGQIDAQLLQRELGRFTAEDLLNLGIAQAIVRMGSARDTFNVRIPLAQHRESNRATIIERSRKCYCRNRAELEKLLEEETNSENSEHRTWIVDAQGDAFTRDQLAEGKRPRQGQGEPIQKPSSQEPDDAATSTRDPGTSVDKEMRQYLEHIAEYPFIPALERDELLKMSRYKGGLLRQRLNESGWIKQHKAKTGRRSGQLTLLEVTQVGYEFLASMRIRAEKPRGRGSFLHKYYAYKLKEYAEATWQGCVAKIEDSSQGRPADVTVRIPGKFERAIAFEIFMTGEAREIRGIARDIEIFDQVIVCTTNP